MCQEYMQSSTKDLLIQMLCNELISDEKAQNVAEKATGCKSMFKNNKQDELKDLYKLFSKVEPTLGHVLQEM